MHVDAAAETFPGWLDQDFEVVLADLARRFPGVPAWHGEWTGSWWAVVGDRLLEAAGPFVLAEMIRTAIAAHRPPPPPPPSPRPAPRPERPPSRHAAARPSGRFLGRLRNVLTRTAPAR